MLIDSLKTLPPELREFVYSYLLSGDEDGTVRIRQRRNVEDGLWSTEDLSAVLGLNENPIYVARRRQRPHQNWPNEVEDALFQAMEWLNKYDVRSRRLPSGNRVISELIYELTGQVRSRKQISSHIQELRVYSRLGRTETAQDVDTQQATKVVNLGPAVSYENSTILTKISDSFSTMASKSKGTLSLRCSTTFARNLLSLSLVNRFYRNECLHHLASNIRFDFGFDGHALQHFCSTAPAEILKAMRHLRVTLVEGYMPQLPDLPNLHTLAVDLWPRNPTRRPQNIHRPDSTDRAWGTQTEKLLDGSGVVLAVRARLRLEMRWAADCERFEREYVERGRWRQVNRENENGASDQEGPTCRRCYELCGNGKTVVEVTGKEKEAASAGGGLVF